MVKIQKTINGDSHNQDYVVFLKKKEKKLNISVPFFQGPIKLKEQESVWYKDLNMYMTVALLHQISLFTDFFTAIIRFTGLLDNYY